MPDSIYHLPFTIYQKGCGLAVLKSWKNCVKNFELCPLSTKVEIYLTSQVFFFERLSTAFGHFFSSYKQPCLVNLHLLFDGLYTVSPTLTNTTIYKRRSIL